MSAYFVFIRYEVKGILFYGGSNDKKIYCAVMPTMNYHVNLSSAEDLFSHPLLSITFTRLIMVIIIVSDLFNTSCQRSI